jgi:hypothetical protein
MVFNKESLLNDENAREELYRLTEVLQTQKAIPYFGQQLIYGGFSHQHNLDLRILCGYSLLGNPTIHFFEYQLLWSESGFAGISQSPSIPQLFWNYANRNQYQLSEPDQTRSYHAIKMLLDSQTSLAPTQTNLYIARGGIESSY